MYISAETVPSVIERGAAAMKAKRRELINQPLERIWPDLMRAAIQSLRDNITEEMAEAGAFTDGPLDCWQSMIDAALKPEVQP
jgi:hypothetical protein